MTQANIKTEHMPIAFAMLYAAFETALTLIAENADGEEWHRELYERIQGQLDEYNALLTAASQIERDNIPTFQQDMPGAVRAGSATVDTAFDSVLSKMRGNSDGNSTV